MNLPRPSSARVSLVAAIGLGAAVVALPGCGPASEGRPAGSIEVKNSRTTSVSEAVKAKSSPRAR